MTAEVLTRRDINVLSIYARAPWMDTFTRQNLEVRLTPTGKGVMRHLVYLSDRGPKPPENLDRFSEDAAFFWNWAKRQATAIPASTD